MMQDDDQSQSESPSPPVPDHCVVPGARGVRGGDSLHTVISRCPRCRELVTIPAGLDPEAEVRCPLCVVVYRLREALAEVPPALIPVDPGAITGPHPGSDASARPGLVTEPCHVAGLPLAVEEGAETPRSASEASPLAHAWQKAEAVSEVGIQTGYDASPVIDTGQTPADAEALAAFGREASGREYEAVAGRAAGRPLRRKHEKGVIRFLIEVILGGVVGLTIGYYVLCWVLGPRSGLPKLPLPLLPHTMHWFKGAEEPEPNAGQPSVGEPDTSKRLAPGQPQLQPPGAKGNERSQPSASPHAPPPKGTGEGGRGKADGGKVESAEATGDGG